MFLRDEHVNTGVCLEAACEFNSVEGRQWKSASATGCESEADFDYAYDKDPPPIV